LKAEPNLTPLLDMVLQLVMFFMLVANFTMADLNENIKLPSATQAKATDKTEADTLTLNIDAKGRLITNDGEEPREGQAEIHTFLEREYRKKEELSKSRNEKEVNTVVIIRAHSEADFAPVYTVLREAKLVGFKKWQLRAQILNPPS
jgi:biopolymer transport protein ExbD